MNEPVLVINANYEPLNICSTRRALGLLLTGRAEMIANGRGYVHTVRLTIPRPSVIRLDRMIKRPRPKVRLTKRELFRRDNYTCQYCGQRLAHLTMDHVVPRHRGGEHVWSNLVTACPACNLRKGGRTLGEAHMALQRTPWEPMATTAYLFGPMLESNQAWRPFLEGW
jgi:5-methylcytosine-specific restriction endonuclease McrA